MRTTLRTSIGVATLAALATLYVGLVVLATPLLRGARLDLTDNHLYTLAPGTRHLIDGLREPITLRYYHSADAAVAVPALRAYAVRVRELLQEITARSHGRIRLLVVDPRPFSDDEDRATEAGLKPVPLGTGDPLWFGLAASNSTDGHAVIGFFDPQKEQLLEYEVSRLIQQLGYPKRKVVGLLSTLPLDGTQDPASKALTPPPEVVREMRELFDVKTIAPAAETLPEGLDALMLVQPKGLSPALSYAIDQYVLAGGRLLLCVDPDAALASRDDDEEVGTDRASTFEPMLSAWGVHYDPKVAVGDPEHALLVGGQGGSAPVRHLAFTGLTDDSFAHGDAITSALGSVNFATPGFLEARRVTGVEFEPLVTTGLGAGPISVTKLGPGSSPESLRDGFRGAGRRYVIAARLSGLLGSGYPKGPPAGVAAGTHLARARRTANVVIVADTDFLSDMLWVHSSEVYGHRVAEPWANNGDLALNALDNLTESPDLIGIRGRPTFSRPFTRIEALRARADERLRDKAAELERELTATDRTLDELQSGHADRNAQTPSAEQRRELVRFQEKKLRIRKELRDVRRGVDQQIDRLGTMLKALNVLAMPLLVALTAVSFALIARRRRARSGVVP